MSYFAFSRMVFVVLTLFVLLRSSAQADFIVLYNGTGLPSSQSWLSYASNGLLNGGTSTQTQVASGVRLQTDGPVSAGYGSYTPFAQLQNAAFPVLNRANGFELSFSLAIAAESHTSNDRAGFSVILLGSDSQGIEVGFWDSQVWAQNVGFTRGESFNIATTTPRDYRLRIESDTYRLFAGSDQLLTGAVRNYSAFGPPYSLPNMLFLGDNTSSGMADVTLGAITLQSNLAAVPEPSSSMLLIGAGGFLFCLFKRHAWLRLAIGRQDLKMMNARG